MANIQPTWAGLPDSGSGDGWVIQWGPMQNGDVAVKATLEWLRENETDARAYIAAKKEKAEAAE
jgi:hypothetical protein